jgi:two-component system, chemotaxis family, chemotaxis protein CheY
MAFRVLIVDDSPAMRGVIRRIMELSGFDLEQCLEAGNGEQALGVLKGQWVDLILTDINMPVMNGEELLNRLHGDELLNTIPVVVISTDASEHRIGRMLGLGAKGYVAKPFFPEMLREELERVLEVSNA